MKRLIAVLLAVCMLLAFTACGSEDSSTMVTIKNETGHTIDNIYLSPVDSDSWGDPVTIAKVNNGSSIKVDPEKFMVESTSIYDFGAIDSDAVNYDVYEIPLAPGASLVLTETTLTVTDANGNSTSYDTYVYTE